MSLSIATLLEAAEYLERRERGRDTVRYTIHDRLDPSSSLLPEPSLPPVNVSLLFFFVFVFCSFFFFCSRLLVVSCVVLHFLRARLEAFVSASTSCQWRARRLLTVNALGLTLALARTSASAHSLARTIPML